jgi:hypothetical protein
MPRQEPWSSHDIAEGTTSTSPHSFSELMEKVRITREKTRRRFVPLRKTIFDDSSIEVLSDNPRILVNIIETEHASLWYGLYDGTLVEALLDREKQLVERIIETYFQGIMPVIPILKTQVDRDPKYRINGPHTRVYSLYGGMNLRTLTDKREGDVNDFSPENFPRYLSSLSEMLSRRGYPKLRVNFRKEFLLHTIKEMLKNFNFPKLGANSQREISLETIEKILKYVELVKKHLRENDSENKALSLEILELEINTKMRAMLKIFDLMGIDHGHPHSGNVVVSGSPYPLTRERLESELINPEQLITDKDELIASYPNCHVYPFFIDLDAVRLKKDKPAVSHYSKDNLVQLLKSETNHLRQLLIAELLPVVHWPDTFIERLSEEKKLADHIIPRLKRKAYVESYTPEELKVLFAPLISKQLLTSGGFAERLLLEIVPPLTENNFTGEFEKSWRSWFSFFGSTQVSQAFKNFFIHTLIEGRSVYTSDYNRDNISDFLMGKATHLDILLSELGRKEFDEYEVPYPPDIRKELINLFKTAA